MTARKKKIVIGRFEHILFQNVPEGAANAKIDTGAKTSSVHTGRIKETMEGDAEFIEFTILGNKKNKIKTTEYTTRFIKSSNGLRQKRYIVKLNVVFGEKKYKAEFSLAKRKEMNFPVLLGRRFLRRGFVVDVSKKYTQKIPVTT